VLGFFFALSHRRPQPLAVVGGDVECGGLRFRQSLHLEEPFDFS
jgi:hypothetical protein